MASLDDFRSFHGMRCSPLKARRCIHSFNGKILFQPVGYQEQQHSLEAYDYSQGFLRLNLFSYYFLVLASFTGWSSLTGRTKYLDVVEENRTFSTEESLSSHAHPELVATPRVWKYISAEALELVLLRRFEYAFGGWAQAKVVMFHIWDPRLEKLSLVEVFHCDNRILLRGAELLQRLRNMLLPSSLQGKGGWIA